MVQGPLFQQLCKGPYFYLCKVLLPISSRVVHKYILRDFGECCESVPLDHPGSYVSISIKIYITIILARVVQVDVFYCESLSCYICVVMVVVVSSWNTGFVFKFGITKDLQ